MVYRDSESLFWSPYMIYYHYLIFKMFFFFHQRVFRCFVDVDVRSLRDGSADDTHYRSSVLMGINSRADRGSAEGELI